MPLHKIDFEYGYGDQWEWTAAAWLEKNGYLPGREHHQNGGAECLRLYCERKNIRLVSEVDDVDRKRDL
jgi:hypothetical protein